MTMTEQQKNKILRHIACMQYDLGTLSYSLDSSKDAKTFGSILHHLSIINTEIIDCKIGIPSIVEAEVNF